ncbi:MAG: 3-hydroxyacyl-CoA dehydrogenase [SAR324 cluster bacterium]|nr:3-hydroxyacyl-CoA dehydrogenase [SAR324 cluster bacterium]
MELKDKVAIVTGGASGLGEACVRLFVQQGAKVAILDYNDHRGEQVAKELGAMVMCHKTDVSSDDSVKNAVAAVSQKWGNIHVVVSCAGVGNPMKILSKRKGLMPFDYFSKVININLIGTMNVIRHASDKMQDNQPLADGERGVIINTASVAAYDGQVGQAAYSASKGGIVGMTLPIAREFASYGIRVVTIAPGLFKTPMMESLPEDAQTSLAAAVPFPKRLGNPAEYAQLARHIVENVMLNGETIRLDGSIRLQMN